MRRGHGLLRGLVVVGVADRHDVHRLLDAVLGAGDLALHPDAPVVLGEEVAQIAALRGHGRALVEGAVTGLARDLGRLLHLGEHPAVPHHPPEGVAIDAVEPARVVDVRRRHLRIVHEEGAVQERVGRPLDLGPAGSSGGQLGQPAEVQPDGRVAVVAGRAGLRGRRRHHGVGARVAGFGAVRGRVQGTPTVRRSGTGRGRPRSPRRDTPRRSRRARGRRDPGSRGGTACTPCGSGPGSATRGPRGRPTDRGAAAARGAPRRARRRSRRAHSRGRPRSATRASAGSRSRSSRPRGAPRSSRGARSSGARPAHRGSRRRCPPPRGGPSADEAHVGEVVAQGRDALVAPAGALRGDTGLGLFFASGSPPWQSTQDSGSPGASPRCRVTFEAALDAGAAPAARRQGPWPDATGRVAPGGTPSAADRSGSPRPRRRSTGEPLSREAARRTEPFENFAFAPNVLGDRRRHVDRPMVVLDDRCQQLLKSDPHTAPQTKRRSSDPSRVVEAARPGVEVLVGGRTPGGPSPRSSRRSVSSPRIVSSSCRSDPGVRARRTTSL